MAKVERLKLKGRVNKLLQAEAKADKLEDDLSNARQTRDMLRAAMIENTGLSKADLARILDKTTPAISNSIVRAAERSDS